MKKITINNINLSLKILKIIVSLAMIVLFGKLVLVAQVQQDGFSQLANYQTTIETSIEIPRGEIFDCNNNLIVGNESEQDLMYIESDIMNQEEKIALAQQVVTLITIDDLELNQTEVTDLWLSDSDNLISAYDNLSEVEYNDYADADVNEQNEILRNQVDENETEQMVDNLGAETVEILILMNQATSKNAITIKSDLTTNEQMAIESNYGELGGFYVADYWQRSYPYGDLMTSFLGDYGEMELEDQEYYQSQGYSINENVGTSYLEKQLEPILHSSPKTIELYFDENGNIIGQDVVDDGKRGDDVVLTIDAEFQKAVEEILNDYLNETNYTYANNGFVTVTDPSNGNILAMAGKSEYDDQVVDNAIGNFTQAYEVGSSVKVAVLLMGYDLDAIDIGEVIVDEPMTFQGTPTKSSHETFGAIDDLTAISRSSNVYFYKTFLAIAGQTYVENGPLYIDPIYFDVVRSEYEEFGLGVSTGIDIENENIGYRGSSTEPGLYLDLANGQYDTYTTLQMNQYALTIANGGTRYKENYIKSINEPGELNEPGKIKYQQRAVILNQLSMSDEEIARAQLAMEGCPTDGYSTCADSNFELVPASVAAKTGTAEAFVWDNDLNGSVKVDNSSFIGYTPADDPEIAVSVVLPSFVEDAGTYSVNASNIAQEVMTSYYEVKEDEQ